MRFEWKIVADSACTWCIMDRQLHFCWRNTDPNATNPATANNCIYSVEAARPHMKCINKKIE